MKLLKDLDVVDKRVFLRADLDVPLEEGNVDIATRLTNVKPTVDNLVEHGASQVIIAGHIDRPTGPDPTKSTKNLLESLEKILGQNVAFSEQLTTGGSFKDNKIILLENLRFWPGEEANDMDFAKKLAEMADVYVNDAFGNCHRVHASMVALPLLLPHAAGIHLEEEVNQLTKLVDQPQKPFVAIVGGAKIETKIPVISNLCQIADWVLVGGELPIEIAKQNLKFAENVVVGQLTDDGKDINEATVGKFVSTIKDAKTIVWNGPLGLFEEGHVNGTLAIADAIAQSGAYSVVGGGDSTQFLGTKGILSKFSFVSAGGGAMLEFLSGKKLPAIEALS